MRKRAFVASLLMLLFAPHARSWGEDASAKGSVDNPALITWEATLAAGKVVELISRDGDLSRFAQARGERRLAITTSLENKPEDVVTFRIFEVKEVENAGEALRQIEKVSLRLGASYSTALQPAVTLRLKRVHPASSGATVKEEAYPTSSGPVTGTLISWEMTTPSQKRTRVVGRAGELTRVEVEGYSIGILPSAKRENAVDFRIFKITQVRDAGEALKEINHFTLATGGEQVASQSPNIVLRLTGVRP
ncbi:MAG TPA: hypothetical protein VLB76_18580 [Thermoanaerobaculia bacterium]|jgi:hypothetical protein|nr:hypothetical protein [Thermoanaerobaculia bacterium]